MFPDLTDEEFKDAYPPESAGSLMIDKSGVPIATTGTSLKVLWESLSTSGYGYDTINYVYVTDHISHLRGVFSIKEFLQHHDKQETVDDIMHREVISVKAHTDQERAALLALQHSVKAIPVVDEDNIFLGLLPFGIILKILDTEAVEDILRFGGVYHKEASDDPARLSTLQSIKHRLPWLLLGLGGGLVAASIIRSFEETLSQNLILAAFIPLIVYMADAVGTQMEAFIIRDLAVYPTLDFTSYFLKQISIVALIGLVLGVALALTSLVLYGDTRVSIILGVALFTATLSAVLSGLTIPYLFSKLEFDPANASGPIATILQDVLSVLIYFLVASWVL